MSSAETIPNSSIAVPDLGASRLALAWAIGVISGFLYLSYGMEVPVNQLRFPPAIPLPWHRVLRLIFPLALFLCSDRKMNLSLISLWNKILFLLVFFAVPFLAVVNRPDLGFLQFSAGPVILGGAILLAILQLKRQTLAMFAFGIGTAAMFLWSMSIGFYGFAQSTYFSRPRIHLGLDHPLNTSSMLVGGGVFLFMLARHYSNWLARVPCWVRNLVMMTIFGTLLGFAFAADSKNMLAAIAVFGMVYTLIKRLDRFLLLQSILVGLTILCPLILYGLAYAAVSGLAGVPSVDAARLQAYGVTVQRIVDHIYGANGWQWFEFLQPLRQEAATFATVESVFLSYIVNFGLWSILPFAAFWTAAGLRLVKEQRQLGLALWVALMVMFTFDAQGFTPSNMVIFMLFAYVVYDAFLSDRGLTLPR